MCGVFAGVVAFVVWMGAVSCPFPPRDVVLPVSGRVLERFVAPRCERCAGRRGMTVATEQGSPVRATTSGEVTFAGQVGGSLWVVQEVAPGVRVTYGRLAAIATGVDTGEPLVTGQVLGTAHSRVYLGVRVGETPHDPSRCWGRRPRLVEPNVGRSARPR